MIISLDMYQTLFAAVCVLMLGRFLRRRVRLLERFQILHSRAGHRRRAVCRFHLSLLCDRHCRV